MYRLVLCCAILTLAEPYGEHCRNGDRCSGNTRRNNLEIMLEPIERDLIEQEERFVQFCNEKSPAMIEQDFGMDNYRFIYDLPEARDARITVRIKYKFLLTTATSIDDQEIIFQDVKVLPEIVDTEAAVWTYDGQTLTIKMPYKIALGEHGIKVCGDVNKQIIDVPQAQSSGSRHGPQDSSVSGYNVPYRRSGSRYGSQDSSVNEYNIPDRRSGSRYESQDFFVNEYNVPDRRSGSRHGPQDSSVNGYNTPDRRSGSRYGSQGSSENGYNVPARRPGSSYGSQDSSVNGYNVPGRRSGSRYYGSQDSSGNGYSVPGRRPSGFKYRSKDPTENGDDGQDYA